MSYYNLFINTKRAQTIRHYFLHLPLKEILLKCRIKRKGNKFIGRDGFCERFLDSTPEITIEKCFENCRFQKSKGASVENEQ